VVADSGAAKSGARSHLTAGKLRPLNQPRAVSVQTDENGVPVSVTNYAVESVIEYWRVEDEWWRPRAIDRMYWRLLLDDGRTIDVYYDGVCKRWYRQAYTR
jgi:hypothetical protein